MHDQISAMGIDLEPPRSREHVVPEITVTGPDGHSCGFVQRLPGVAQSTK